MRPLHPGKATKGSSLFGTAQAGSLYVGYKSGSLDPEGVGVGTGQPGDGLWDFDTDIAGTDSTQYWQGVAIEFDSDATPDRYPTPESRPFWYFDYGNESNQGNTGLWQAFPGYANQWDQILYRDVSVDADAVNNLALDYIVELSQNISTELGGTGWFNPDPTDPGNFRTGITDSFMVWVGLPKDGVYDTNRRWLSEVLDFSSVDQPAKLFALGGLGDAPCTPQTGNTGALPLPDLGTGTITYRIALQVKTNRTHGDDTNGIQATNSVAGAAVVDNVTLNAGDIGTFDADGDIKARFVHDGVGGGTLNSPTDSWIATGKPPAAYGHVHSAYTLPLADDPCGPLGSTSRLCTLDNNVVTGSNHDDLDALPHGFVRESHAALLGPEIDFTGPRAADQGTAAILGGFNLFRVEYDIHTGAMDLDQAVFWNIGAMYKGAATVQPAGAAVRSWSPGLVFPAIFFNPDPGCFLFSTDTDLDGIVPPPRNPVTSAIQIDAYRLHFWTQTRCQRFGATLLCGQPGGGYFDNIKASFTTGGGAAITVALWHVFQDSFPVNEDNFAVGSAEFDTTTAQVKSGLNNAPTNEMTAGVSPGDTTIVNAAFGTDTRLDLVFRILPGPGSYATAGDVNSGLVERDPGNPFWATYLASPGAVSAGDHFGGTKWDKETWNSARMDSADNGNIAKVGSLGMPVVGQWAATLHEDDPNYASLGISRRRCYLVDPAGQVNDTNVCCNEAQCTGAPFNETWPPAVYAAEFSPGSWADTTTLEGTKMLPDGYFTPGTSIEYFFRRSDASNAFANVAMSPDTNVASNQAAMGPHSDGQRWMEVGVFPDRWKANLYNGLGSACMLVVDAGDRRGQEQSIGVALDNLGYGKNNGAARGWVQPNLGPLDQDNPANHVSANNGQKGLSFDWYDISASESAEAGRPGCRLADQTTQPAGYQCYQGPTEDVLADGYSVVLWFADDLETGNFHDAADNQEQANDVALLNNFLLGAGSGTERAAWIASDGAANDLNTSADLGASLGMMTVTFGAEFVAEAYRDASANVATPAVYDPVHASFNAAGEYGYNNFCQLFPDVILVSAVGGAAGAVNAALYEDASHRGLAINPGTYVAAVYKPADPGASRYFATLFSGNQVPNILGDTQAAGGDIIGRIRFVDDALNAFGLCAALGTPTQVGNTPGLSLNFVKGAFPNPARLGAASVNFSLAQPVKVKIRFYNVAGRLVHEIEHEGRQGANTVRWDGATSTGMRASAGVYFYRLTAPGITFQNNDQRMVLLGSNN